MHVAHFTDHHSECLRGTRRHVRSSGGAGRRAEQRMPMSDDSGSEDSRSDVNVYNPVRELAALHALDGESEDEVEDSSYRPSRRGADKAFEPLPVTSLGDPNYSLSYQFEKGAVGNTLERYRDMSAIDIVLDLCLPFFNVLVDCSSGGGHSDISMKDLFCYHAFLCLRALHHLDNIESYHQPPSTIAWSDSVKLILSNLSTQRFHYIRSNLKAYKCEDNATARSRSWKVDCAVESIRYTFQRVHRTPDELLSFNEVIAPGCGMRNPIYIPLGRSQPVGGFRFLLMADCKTKIVLNFMLDNNSFTVDNCRGVAGGCVGAAIENVIGGAQLTGKWHKVMLDNYYASVALVEHMRDKRHVLCAGTAQRKHIDKAVHFGDSKRPKPSQQHVIGSLKMAWNRTARIYQYAWMDSRSVYFIDSVYGPGKEVQIARKNSSGDSITCHVPKLIDAHDTLMHDSNFSDQIGKRFDVDPARSTKKYTVRVFEILFSMVLGQAYNVHCVCRASTSAVLSHAEFKVQVIDGFMNHPVVKSPAILNSAEINGTSVSAEHKLVQFPPGSYGNGSQKRRRIRCRHCPNVTVPGKVNNKRHTNWYCNRCNVGFHPDCFHSYHKVCNHNYVHPRPVHCVLAVSDSTSKKRGVELL